MFTSSLSWTFTHYTMKKAAAKAAKTMKYGMSSVEGIPPLSLTSTLKDLPLSPKPSNNTGVKNNESQNSHQQLRIKLSGRKNHLA